MSRFRTAVVVVLSILLSVVGTSLPSQAAVLTPKLTIALDGNSLAPSSISNFSTAARLRVNLTISSGTFTLPLTTVADTGVTLGTGFALTGNMISLIGTQRQLNDALDLAVITPTCGKEATITGNVTLGDEYMWFNADNGHWYMHVYVPGGISWADAKTAADAKTFADGEGHGYLATITSAEENTWVNNHFPWNDWLGANDVATEGDWTWVDGPEAGTLFYSQGAKVDGQYSNFGSGEPNNWENIEHWLMQWGGDTWNDGNGNDTYLVEFGGYPGDNFNGLPSAEVSAKVSTPALMTGAGTEASPFEISTTADLLKMSPCFGVGVYFKQTTDINLPADFNGIGADFVGTYDGNGKKIDGSAVGNLTNSVFGNVHGSTDVADTVIKNLTLQNFTNAGRCQQGILAGVLTRATVDNVSVSAAFPISSCEMGAIAYQSNNALVKNSSVNVTANGSEMVYAVGGLVGMSQSTVFQNDRCTVDIQLLRDGFIMDVMGIGGCIGMSNEDTISSLTATGNILTAQNSNPMMFMRGAMEIGGLVGRTWHSTIDKSGASVDIGGIRVELVGGLVGTSETSSITRSYSSGNILGADSDYAGGLLGNGWETNISDSYSTGSLSCNRYCGALVGQIQNSTITRTYSLTSITNLQNLENAHGLLGGSVQNVTVTDSFWNPEAVGVPGTVSQWGSELPKSIDQLKLIGTYTNWSISATPSSQNDWAICSTANAGLPYLAWQEVANACTKSFTTTQKPTITGDSFVGRTLTANLGAWDSAAEVTYQWYRNGVAISGATGLTYKTVQQDLGKRLVFKVNGIKAGYASVVQESLALLITSVPVTKTIVIGGFAGKSSKSSPAVKKQVVKAIAGVGTILSITCTGFDTGKKLSAAQAKLAKARATTVCNMVKVAKNAATTTLLSSIAKAADKMKAGVRVTITSVKP